jgi:hypothetical protein
VTADPTSYVANEATEWRPFTPPAKVFFERALAKLAERHRALVDVIDGTAVTMGEMGTKTCGVAAWESSFACASRFERTLFLAPTFFRLAYYPETGVENAAFALMHEALHLKHDLPVETFWTRERTAYKLSWPHKQDFGFWARPSTFWRDITEHTAQFTALLPNPFGRAKGSVVTDAEWEWAHR